MSHFNSFFIVPCQLKVNPIVLKNISMLFFSLAISFTLDTGLSDFKIMLPSSWNHFY